MRPTSFNGRPAVVKDYLDVETASIMCFGSGALNEARLQDIRGVRVPAILHYERRPQGERVILERCEGHVVAAAQWDYERAREAGQALGRIHASTGEWFGPLDGSSRYATFAESFEPRWRQALALVRDIDAPLAGAATRWAREHVSAVEHVGPPVLVHGDFGPANILWGGSGLIALDWEHARYGSAVEDWAKVVLGCGFAEPNAFCPRDDVLTGLADGWFDMQGRPPPLRDPALAAVVVYLAAALGAFFSTSSFIDGRLRWLRDVVG